MQKFIGLIFCFSFFCFSLFGQENDEPVKLGEVWKDTNGKTINAHGAGILLFGDTYYMFGEIKNGQTRLVPGQNWEDYRVPAGGISCYASKDLINWQYMGVALTSVTGDSTNDLDTGRVIERPKVIYNEQTKKFVMWMHIDKEDYSYAHAGVAISDKPEGPYQYKGSLRPNGQMSRDMTLYKDDDGKAYLIYASEDNNTMQICLLSEDYLSPTSKYSRLLVNERREAPAIFKQGGKYYLITSLCSGWSPNPALYSVADSLMGAWKNRGNPCLGQHAETTFESQSTFVLPVKGTTGSYIFMADRWNKTDLPDSRYVWLPFQMKMGNAEIKMPDPVIQKIPGNDSSSAYNYSWKTNGRVILDSLGVLPFSIIQYAVKIKCQDTNTKANSFVRFYDSSDQELLINKSAPVSDNKFVETGYYTEAPANVKYAKFGVEVDIRNPGFIEADGFNLELNIGAKKGQPSVQCNLNEYMKPFWKSDTIYNETVLMYSQNGKPAKGKLLFQPSRIISVKSYDLLRKFKNVKDYRLTGNTISRPAGSAMPFRADTSFDNTHDLAWYNLQSQWVVVTYIHRDKWMGPTPEFKGDQLPLFLSKLKAKKSVKIVGYGMSITRGQDVSGYVHVAPYMPTYLDLVARELRKNYRYDSIELTNAALPGATVSWGAEYAEKYINPMKPDLVIIDFGMNDFWRYTPEEFKGYVLTIISKVKQENPQAEFLLISNMDFDPAYILNSDKYKSFYVSNMQGYKTVLKEMETAGIINLDMTTISDAIYLRKKAKDCIANPLHPNDYMARWYAQGLAALLCR